MSLFQPARKIHAVFVWGLGLTLFALVAAPLVQMTLIAHAAPGDFALIEDFPSTSGDVTDFVSDGEFAYVAGGYSRIGTSSGSLARVNNETGAILSFPDFADGDVDVVISDGDGGFYVAGGYVYVDQERVRYLSHVSSSGEVTPIGQDIDWDFTPQIEALAVDDEYLYLAGDILVYTSEEEYRGVIRFDRETGEMDETFDLDAVGYVNTLELNGSTLYIGGEFSGIAGVDIPRVMSIDTLTQEANEFNTGLDNGYVYDLVFFDSALYVAGNFDFVNSGIFRADAVTGEIDESFVIDVGESGTINSVDNIEESGGDLYMSGSFCFSDIDFGDSSFCDIARIDTSGALDTDFFVNSEYFNDEFEVWDMKVDSSGDVYIAGYFYGYDDGLFINYPVIKIDNTDGSFDSDFSTSSIYGDAESVAFGEDIVVFGGDSFLLNFKRRPDLNKINLSTRQVDFNFDFGSNIEDFDVDIDDLVYAEGSLYVTGYFANYDGIEDEFYDLVRVDPITGEVDLDFAFEFEEQIDGLAYHDGSLYVGTPYLDGDKVSRVSTETGELDTSFLDLDIDMEVNTLVVHGDTLFVLGYSETNVLVAVDLNSEEILEQYTIPVFTSASTNDLLVHDGYIYVAGDFVYQDGDVEIFYLLRIDQETGEIDPTFSFALDDYVASLAYYAGYLYVSGDELNIPLSEDVNQNYLIRINLVTGEIDTDFVIDFDDEIYDLLILDQYLLVGGTYELVNDASRTYLAMLELDPTDEVEPTPTPTPSPRKKTAKVDRKCSADKPGFAPQLYRIDRNGTEATLWLRPGGNPYNGFVVWYGEGSSTDKYAEVVNVKDATGMVVHTVKNLQAGQSYSFRVQSKNNCAYSEMSNTMQTGGRNTSAIATNGGMIQNLIQRVGANISTPPTPPAATLPSSPPTPPGQPLPADMDQVEGTPIDAPTPARSGFFGWLRGLLGR